MFCLETFMTKSNAFRYYWCVSKQEKNRDGIFLYLFTDNAYLGSETFMIECDSYVLSTNSELVVAFNNSVILFSIYRNFRRIIWGSNKHA